MNLIWVTIEGYKCFEKKWKMNVDGKTIAIVGPNEAGKTSFLRALLHLNTVDPFIQSGGSQELTRGMSILGSKIIVEAGFLLDETDKKAVAHLHEGEKIRWMVVSKKAEGGTFYANLSPAPTRDLHPREETIKVIIEAGLTDRLSNLLEDSTKGFSKEEFDNLISALNTGVQTLEDDIFEKLQNFASFLEKELSPADIALLRNLPQQLNNLIAHEKEPHPEPIARNILFNRRPTFLLFTQEARSLESEYAIEKLGEPPPTAINNLARLAGLNLKELATALTDKDHGLVETLEEQANDRLRRIMAETWSQSGITVRLRIDGGILRVLVGSSQAPYVSIAERSDGLRQFIALLAFTTLEKTEQVPILLVDEAETHLHYDAQADLVQMFAKQEVVSKVIYTTHSVGCLPEDLGTGIRLIEPTGPRTSRIRNWFWDSSIPGFSPLLFGMGARTLAFIPVRFALITEGATDLILLPTLLREATSRSYLGFQVAPGLSSASEEEIGLLENGAPRTAYLVDSDSGGDDVRRKLKHAGISEDRIFHLPDEVKQGMVIEDFVDEQVYISAVNEELRRSHGQEISFPVELITVANRPKAVEEWCKANSVKPPSKRAVAYRILWIRPEKSILNERLRDGLQQLFVDITKILQAPKA